jgi:uncharacterized protein (TIGR02270 family)
MLSQSTWSPTTEQTIHHGTPSTLVISQRSFYVELYEEHLAEGSFLYAQHLIYLHDLELTWSDLEQWEQRFEAHIDALVVGGDLALDVCKQRCIAGDFGELHAAVRVFCRQHRPELAYAVLQHLDMADEPKVQAVIDALKAECPSAWHDDLLRIMLGKHKQLIPALAETLSYRRAPIEETLLRVLPSCEQPALPRVLRALARVGGERSRAALAPYLRSEDADVAEAACRGLARLGDYQVLRHGLIAAQLRPWPVIALGIGGDHTAVNVLIDLARSDKVSGDVLLSLGMLGDLRSVSTVFDLLTNKKHAMAAAIALQTITGAALLEQAFVPDEMDPDELLPEERKTYDETGELPKRSDGKAFGTNVTQLSVNPVTWRAWLTERREEFNPRLRYRHGKPISPAASLEALQDEHTPNRVRALICEELVVRFRAPVALEIDMPVREQRKQLADLAQWVQSDGHKFAPGVWHFGARPMTDSAAPAPPR